VEEMQRLENVKLSSTESERQDLTSASTGEGVNSEQW